MPEARAHRELDWQALLWDALCAPGRLGDTYNRFYTYSYLNQLLLLQQGVREPVATYNRWQTLGRQVVKGAKAKEILRPIVVKRNDEDEHGQPVEKNFTRFKLVKCLFPLSDTVGEPLPPVEIPEWDWERAKERLGITEVPFSSLDGNTQGYSIGRELAINPVAKYPNKTRFHELGHIVLGHTTEPDPSMHRGVREFQAEATSHLARNELGLKDAQQDEVSRAYMQNWLTQAGVLPTERNFREVFAATDSILRAGRISVGTELSTGTAADHALHAPAQ